MKIAFLSLSLMVLASWSCSGNHRAPNVPQPATEEPKKDMPKVAEMPPEQQDSTRIIKEIKAAYQRINAAALTKKSFEWESDTLCEAPPMGGTVTYFYEGDKLVKVFNDGGEDHGEWKEEYYFKDGALFFIYQKNAYGGAANPTEVKYENRYYFDKDRLVSKIESIEDGKNDADGLSRLKQTAYRLSRAKDAKEISKVLSCD